MLTVLWLFGGVNGRGAGESGGEGHEEEWEDGWEEHGDGWSLEYSCVSGGWVINESQARTKYSTPAYKGIIKKAQCHGQDESRNASRPGAYASNLIYAHRYGSVYFFNSSCVVPDSPPLLSSVEHPPLFHTGLHHHLTIIQTQPISTTCSITFVVLGQPPLIARSLTSPPSIPITRSIHVINLQVVQYRSCLSNPQHDRVVFFSFTTDENTTTP